MALIGAQAAALTGAVAWRRQDHGAPAAPPEADGGGSPGQGGQGPNPNLPPPPALLFRARPTQRAGPNIHSRATGQAEPPTGGPSRFPLQFLCNFTIRLPELYLFMF